MYILECSDGSYYIGSTIDLKRRIFQHQNGEGAKHTKNRLPVKLVSFELFWRIDFAFYREKQVQGWNRKKKEALIFGKFENLHELAMCRNATSHLGLGFAQPAEVNAVQPWVENDAQPRAENDVQPPVDLLQPVVERSRNDRLQQIIRQIG